MSPKEVLVGDPAPDLRVETFLKGEPIAALASGTVYVVEFWATWCGPCKASIPHLTALQARHPQVPIIGVAVTWKDLDALKTFVQEQDEAIGYRIAADRPPEPGERRGAMHRDWCEASYQAGVPAAFIVDREGRIAWAGHPMELDAPLAAVVDGTWDIAAEAQAHRAALARDKVREARALERAVAACLAEDDRAGALQAYDAAFAAEPDLERTHGFNRFKLLPPTSEAALNYALHLVTGAAATEVNTLFKVGLALSEQAERAEGSPRRRAAALSVEALKRVWVLVGPEPSASLVVRVSQAEAQALILAGHPAQAAVRARAARDAAVKAGVTETAIAALEALVQRSETEAAPTAPAAHAMVCEGDVCRLAAP